MNPKVTATTLFCLNYFNLLLLKFSFNYSETASRRLPNPQNICLAELNENTTSNPLKCRDSPQISRYCKDGEIWISKFGNMQYSKRMLVNIIVINAGYHPEFWTVHLTHDTSPRKAENKLYSEPDFKNIDNPYNREKISPSNSRFVPRLISRFIGLFILLTNNTHSSIKSFM